MSQRIHLPLPAMSALRKLGQDINEARRRRRIPMALMAQRAGITEVTLIKIEKGNPNTAMSGYASVLFVLGLIDKFKNIADIGGDKTGQFFEAKNLPKRIRTNSKER